jgi:hypothetical protein
MSEYLIILVGLIYVYIGIDFMCKGQTGMGITFIAYALANFGLWIEAQ